ncbi:hypothetical protein SALBM135S_06807 [Streptomyces alboniger]
MRLGSGAGGGSAAVCGAGDRCPRATVGKVIEVRRSNDRYRGGEPTAGIESLHAFSFGPHYDPDNLRFGAILACNE